MQHLLLENFYTELSSTFSEESKTHFSSSIHLHASHPVYKGHFGHIPIAPGVCLIQIVKEILASKLQKDLILLNGDNIKFLSLINPQESADFDVLFQVKETAEGFDVSATYINKGMAFVKFKGKFRPGNPADFKA